MNTIETKNPQAIVPVSPEAPQAFVLTADPLPGGAAPRPPEGFAPRRISPMLRGRPSHVLVSLAPLFADELRAATEYETQLGSMGVPDKDALADALVIATGWSQQRAKADLWTKYVREQEAIAWKHASVSVQQLRDPFVLLSERDPNVTTQYPAMSQFFGIRRQNARKANAAKRKKEKARKVVKPETPKTA